MKTAKYFVGLIALGLIFALFSSPAQAAKKKPKANKKSAVAAKTVKCKTKKQKKTPKCKKAKKAQPAASGNLQPQIITAINALQVSAPAAAAYDRNNYKHWSDLDKNGLDARQDVLRVESLIAVGIVNKKVTAGSWYSYYDGVTTTNPSSFDIDHLVPLAEANRSGAYAWSAKAKEAYANDLGDYRTLVAVSASSNRSKSDKDPAQWMPALNKCRYIAEWTAVKTRWSLSIDPAEKSALLTQAASCKTWPVNVVKVNPAAF